MLDKKKLKAAEAAFMQDFPGGFDHPEMVKIGKKHKMSQMTEMVQTSFSKKACKDINATIENMIKVVSRSSMVSMFEKPKFRGFARSLSPDEKEFLVAGLVRLLHGKQALGFEAIVDILKTGKLAKWSLISVIPAYFSPTEEVFVKPTTAKNIISFFEVPDLIYKPTPSWEFYEAYRSLINASKGTVDKSLSPSNPAFTGFLMMTMKV